MMSQYSIGLSKQAISVYKLLLKSEPLSAKEIAASLKIIRHDVYRLTQHLQACGLIDRLEGYPVKYKAKLVNEARKNYLTQQGSWFSELFTSDLSNGIRQDGPDDKPFDISFIQTRDEHLEMMINKIKKAKQSIKYIILALPVGIPAEMIYEFNQAVKRGIDLKIIAQEHSKENHNILMSYKNVGAQVRHGRQIGWHLFLVDDNFSSIAMFDPKNKYIQTGVRLIHQGINSELQGIFEKYWEDAVEL